MWFNIYVEAPVLLRELNRALPVASKFVLYFDSDDTGASVDDYKTTASLLAASLPLTYSTSTQITPSSSPNHSLGQMLDSGVLLAGQQSTDESGKPC